MPTIRSSRPPRGTTRPRSVIQTTRPVGRTARYSHSYAPLCDRTRRPRRPPALRSSGCTHAHESQVRARRRRSGIRTAPRDPWTTSSGRVARCHSHAAICATSIAMRRRSSFSRTPRWARDSAAVRSSTRRSSSWLAASSAACACSRSATSRSQRLVQLRQRARLPERGRRRPPTFERRISALIGLLR